jgi:PAS domain S-box-containing protein
MIDAVSASILGLSDTRLEMEYVENLVRAEDRPELHDKFGAIRNGTTQAVFHEFRISRRESEAWVRLSGVVSQRDSAGAPLLLIGFIEDISQRKRVELELKSYTYELIKQKSLLANLIDNMPLAVLAEDPSDSFRFTLCNNAAEELFGLASDQIVGKRAENIFSSEDAWRYSEQDRLIMLKPRVVDLGEQVITVGDNIRDVRMVKIPVYGPGNKVDLIFVLLEDVTEARSLERQLNHSQKMDAVGRLAGGIAHDFNNMLQAIIGYGNLLSEEMTINAESSESIELVHRAAHQASGLVRQLMAFSRPKTSASFQVDACALVKDLVKMLQSPYREHIAMKVRTCSDKRLDHGRVRQYRAGGDQSLYQCS